MILGLTACGSPSDESSSPTTAATVTSVAGSPPVIQIAGGGATGEGRSAAPMAASEAADSKFAAYINYVYGGDLVDLTAPAASWYFEPGVEPSTDQIAALAAALGVEGDVRELAADMGSGWMVGPDSYEEPTLNVGADVAAPYTDCELYPPGDPMGDTAAAAESGATGDTTAIDTAAPMPECEPTPPPANVPDEATAEQKARELFGSVGIDLDSYELETHADEWGANVTGYLVLEGIRTNVTISVGFGAEGAVTWANGYLATPQRGADYPRIGIEAAVQRLNDQSSSWMGLDTGVAARTDIAVDAVAETAESEPAVAPDATTMPAPADTMVDPIEGACLDDTGSECAPTSIEVEPITVTLTAARPSLEQLWGSDDTVWLLPGYAFDSSDGGIYSVLAVEDQYIQVVQVDPVPVDAPLPADSTATDPVPASTPTTMLLPGWESAAPLVGLAEAEAAKVAEGNGWTMRVVRIDGVDQAVTDDF
ncbi:MAG: hypothetical protein HZB15_03515, partial [Actinobacteria bacterium]|nr:hypothetical protein [Actinomycetota bacterium]